jgi:hypothetical protein
MMTCTAYLVATALLSASLAARAADGNAGPITIVHSGV